MMTIEITCSKCGSGIEVYPSQNSTAAECDVCKHIVDLKFNAEHEQSILKVCPCCQRQDFYQQKDFNRKIGATLFIIAAILSIWTYGISFIVLYAVDFFLFKKLHLIVICYKCTSIFRSVKNINEIRPYDHEMNDRIVYADHNFHGNPIK